MTNSISLYLHFPCFDGVISAVISSEYLRRERGWTTGRIVPVSYDQKETWAKRHLADNAVVVDFLYHREAIFWADHHETTFVSPSLKNNYERRKSPDLIYDPSASSCAEIIWKRAEKTVKEQRFRELVRWAHRIDSAIYGTAEEAIFGSAPALMINLSFLRDSSPDYCRFLIESLRVQTLAEVASSKIVSERYSLIRNALERGQRLFESSARLEDDGIVVFRVPKERSSVLVSRYAPYLAYPKARYSVGILPQSRGAKITAMRNPWLQFRNPSLGNIFRRYGGGGHERVASVLLKSKAEAEDILGAILKDIRAKTGSDSKRAKG